MTNLSKGGEYEALPAMLWWVLLRCTVCRLKGRFLSKNKTIGFAALYIVYLCLGAYGAFWVSDEYDQERLHYFAFFAIPLGVLLPYGVMLYPTYWAENRPLLKMSLLLIFCSYFWGVIIFTNALTGSQPVVYTRLMKSRVEQRSLRVAYRRGGLGFLYRLRW